MSIDRIPSPPSPEPRERPDGPAATGGYDAKRAEQAVVTQPGGHDTGSQRRAETLTREEYADSVRAHGRPIPRDNDQERGERDGKASPRFSVVEAERTLGDTSPTGIGLKPTGEQLLEMKGDEPFPEPPGPSL